MASCHDDLDQDLFTLPLIAIGQVLRQEEMGEEGVGSCERRKRWAWGGVGRERSSQYLKPEP
jgi:hypothetical protein